MSHLPDCDRADIQQSITALRDLVDEMADIANSFNPADKGDRDSLAVYADEIGNTLYDLDSFSDDQIAEVNENEPA